jgi:single-strand DNA-binding protein
MAGSVNKVILLGHLGRDPDVRTSQDGSKIVTLNVATSESWKDRSSGERKEKTEWHRVVIFNPHLAEIAERYMKKGSGAYIEGALQTRKWTDQQGVEKYSTEVVIGKFKGELTLLAGRDGQNRGAQGEDDYGTTQTRDKRPAGDGGGWQAPPDLDDEIPF